MRRLPILALFVLSCAPDKPQGDALPNAEAAPLRIGTVMMENGRRFETAGRAASAERWDLAAYEVEEMLELFEEDMPRALLPGDCDDAIADRTYERLRAEELPALRAAAEREDTSGFDAAFRASATTCNGCHAACRVPFIEVPARPGHTVPTLDPPAEAAR